MAETLIDSGKTSPPRLVSLDVFRGITIAGMVLVNNPGTWSNIYWPLEHSEWHGWTPTDLVFPWFVFIVGVSMALSFRSRIAKGADKKLLTLHTWRRGAMIYLIGFAIVVLTRLPHVDWSHIRIM